MTTTQKTPGYLILRCTSGSYQDTIRYLLEHGYVIESITPIEERRTDDGDVVRVFVVVGRREVTLAVA